MSIPKCWKVSTIILQSKIFYKTVHKIHKIMFKVCKSVRYVTSVEHFNLKNVYSEMSDCCLMSKEHISLQEQVNFQWDDDEVHFVLDQHA
jgi:uncharacterized membrane protein